MQQNILEMLGPVSAEGWGGDNVEYEPEYQLLDELAAGTPESVIGDSSVAGKDPDVGKLIKTAELLWKKSRDLRLAVYWTYGQLSKNGLQGLSDGLELIQGMIGEHWQEFWPMLDPDDDNDPTERVNILRMISPPPGSYGDTMLFINALLNRRLAESKSYTVRDLMIAEGVTQSEETVDPALLNAEMLTVPLAEVQGKHELISHICEVLEAIEADANEKMGDDGYIEFSALKKELGFLGRFYARYADSQAQPAAGQGVASGEAAGNVAASSAAVAAAPLQGTDVRNIRLTKREDALLLLKKCADFFQATEPTSPLPFLIQRALRMADMDFLSLLGEIDQNALERGREQLGVKPPEESY